MVKRIIKRFRNISITKKLYFVIGIMALLIALELFTLLFALNTLSSVRAFVGGEGLWSKAQKDAIYNLQKYARTYNTDDYLNFQYFMKVPLGDHKTLVELNKKDPDIENARRGFIEGRNHPKDINGMIKLFRRFHNIFYIKKAITIWSEADSTIALLIPIGENLRSEIISKFPSEERIDQIIKKIDPLNEKLTLLEDDFSYTLGEGSRWLENIILTILFLVALTVELSGLFLTVSVSIEISKGINNIISVSKKIAKADFSERAIIYSGDEIGQLANSFNQMANDLDEKKEEKLLGEKLILQTTLYETLLRAQSEMGEGVAITENKKIIYANSALCEMYGYSEKEILSMSSFIDIVVEEDKERLTKRLQQRIFEDNSPETGETSIIRKDGSIIDIAYSLKLIKTGDKTQIVSIVRDITEKNKDARLLKTNTEKLQQSNKDLEQFAYVASHDLREPLRTISSYVQLLESRYKNKLDDDANEFIKYTVDGVQRMDKLINDLLTYSRVSKQQETELVDCSQILKTVLININDIIREYKVDIVVDKLPQLKSNSLQMTQLFQNLITNAIKFHSDSVPQIHISGKERKNEWLFSVQDNGIGIDKKYEEKIFVIFQRLHSRNQYEGTGIGLAICKKIIEQHEGKIWFESQPGKGTTFYFTIKKM